MRVQVKIRNLDSPDLTELQVESSNISARGVYFSTDLPLDIGARVEMFLTMPVEIAGKDSRLWRCTGRVVRMQPHSPSQAKAGNGVEIHYYEVLDKAGRPSRIPDPDASRSRSYGVPDRMLFAEVKKRMPRRALIVDDEPAVCQLIQGVLSSSGLDSLTLTKSADATGYLRDEKFDVVLLDFSMPVPSGIELAQQARGSGFNQRTPIIMISDDQRPSAVSEGSDAGASFFLYKPIDMTRLQRLIRVTQGAVEQEKRRFRRVPVRSKVRLSSDHGELDCETIDLSLNGMMVQCPRTVPAGSRVRLTLDMPNGAKPLLGTGAVMRTVGEHQMGIQFNLLRTDENGRPQEFLLPLIIEG